ncbi:MAG TPA: ScyD/ScyE family protein [Thermomicrobiales bacterium]|nr:ScyD/ScyE family protein [Thermomicrobiales bacterium]
MSRAALASLLVALVFCFSPALLAETSAQSATPVSAPAPPPAAMSANVSVFATGLDSPRGLAFGPDGALYVGESGVGGTTSTVGKCEQVPAPVGPYTGGPTGRISKFDAAGQRATVIEGLPSDETSMAIGGEVTSVSAVAFLDGAFYYLLAGGGCSHGNPDAPNGVYTIDAGGKPKLVADLSAFYQAHPVARPNPGDFEPDGTPYSMVAANGKLYVVEPNHGELDAVDPASGAVTRVVDISASQGHIVPSSLALGPDGAFYVGNLTPTPYPDGTAVILRITPDGKLDVFARGLTTVLGLAFDGQGRLYALESSIGNTQQPPFLVPGSGRVLRLGAGGAQETIATGLTFPTAIAFGADGALYASNVGYGMGPTPGKGEIVKIDVSAAPAASPVAPPATGATPVA